MKLYGTLSELVAAVFRSNSQTVTLNPPASPSGSRVLILPDSGGTGATTLADLSTAQTMSNKTLGASNVVSNSTISTFFTDLAQTNQIFIPANTSDTMVLRTLAMPLTNKTLGSTNTATGINMASFTPDAGTHTLTAPTVTDTLTANAATQTLTNKTLTAPVQSSYEDFTEIGTPGNPASGVLRVYSKSGDNLYTLNSAGTETQVGSGSGQKNYLQASSNTATGWTAFGMVSATTDTTAADLPRANTTKTGWKLTSSGTAAGTVTITIAAPAVFTATAHGMQTGYTVNFTTTGTLPSGIVAGAAYYVNRTGANTFNVATTMANLVAGTYVTTTGTQSGTHSFYFGGAYLRFTLDAADYNVKLANQFAQNVASSTAWEVDVYSNTASDYSGTYVRLSQSTDTAALLTQLPNVEGTYRTTFDAPGSASQWLELRFIRSDTSTNQLVGSDLVVGPGAQIQGAAVSQATPYSPTLAGVTVSSPKAYYWREGDRLSGTVTFSPSATAASQFQIPLPSGLTINYAAFGTTQSIVGTSTVNLSSGSNAENIAYAFIDSSIANVILVGGIANGGAGSGTLTPVNGSAVFATSTQNTVSFQGVPINEWAGAGTINVVQNDVEYVSNSSSTDANDTTSFVYGPGGSTGILGTTALTAVRSKRVRFTTPVSTTDKLAIEFNDTSSGGFSEIADARIPFFYTTQNGTTYGVRLVAVNSTDYDVEFQQYSLPNGATFGAAGQAWNGINGNITKWRVRKTAGGQAVGFGIATPGTSAGLVAAAGVPGNTTGNSIAAGYVGEKIQSSRLRSAGSSLSNGTPLNVASISITPGIWDIYASAGFQYASATATSMIAAISTASSTLPGTDTTAVPDSAGQQRETSDPVITTTSTDDSLDIISPAIVVTTTTTYYLVAQSAFSAGSVTAYGYLSATRRA